MSRRRRTLVALLVASTALFAVGASAERDAHAEPASADHESGQAGEGEAGEASGSGSEEERVLGVDLESTPLIVLAVLSGLTLAALTAARGRPSARRVGSGIALVAMTVAVLHLAAAAVGAGLARDAPARRWRATSGR